MIPASNPRKQPTAGKLHPAAPDVQSATREKKWLCVDYLAIYTTLSSYVLSIVVNINAEPRVCK